jgi:phosphinothricin acetyltransferase
MALAYRNMTPHDWPSVSRIYEEGISTGDATFQKKSPSREEWDYEHLVSCRIVAESDGMVVGWVALSPVSGRCVYAGVAEVSIYVSEKYRGMNIGKNLLHRLISESEKEGLWMLQAGIFPENKASLKIHQDAGFRIVGYREKVGKMGDRWRDNMLLERRSRVIGIE